jgi:hypothetical protein
MYVASSTPQLAFVPTEDSHAGAVPKYAGSSWFGEGRQHQAQVLTPNDLRLDGELSAGRLIFIRKPVLFFQAG